MIGGAFSQYDDGLDEAAYATWLDGRDGRGLSSLERLEAELDSLRRALNRDPAHPDRRLRERMAVAEAEFARLRGAQAV